MTLARVKTAVENLPGGQPGGSLLERFSVGSGHTELLASVREDLEMLLNTRAAITSPPADLPHLKQSLLSYGVVDIACVNFLDVDQRLRFTRRLEQTIAVFEPRLTHIRVSMPAVPESGERWVHFRIEASLHDGRPVVIDSKLEPVMRRVTLGGCHD